MRNKQPIDDAPGSNIGYSVYYEEMKVAHFWGLTPDEFYRKPRWVRATMVAFMRGNSGIDYWLYEDSKPKGK